MKKFAILFVLCLFSLNIFGQESYRKINENVIERIRTLYFQEKYEECLDSCFHYINKSCDFYELGHSSHPFKDYGVININQKYSLPYAHFLDRIEDVTYVLYMGAASAYRCSLINLDTDYIIAIEWARACANICKDYIEERKPDEFWTAAEVSEIIFYGDMGVEATQYGSHLLHMFNSKERYANNERKWFEKTGVKIHNSLRKNLSGMETKYSEYPLLQYRITDICTTASLFINENSALKEYEDIFTKRFNEFTNLIENSTNNINDSDIYSGLNKLISMLTYTVIESDICKRIGHNYERFCMENLIKLQDISYCLSGSSRYKLNPTYTLGDIQNCLQEDDCAIVHFEAPLMSGKLYSQNDLGTLFRNYALIITKDQVVPDVWHRGYIKDDVVNDLSVVKEKYPNAKRFFYVGTPRMSFIDIAGTDSSIVRLHSLSQLLYDWPAKSEINEVTFIGDINYEQVGNIKTTNSVGNSIILSENKGGKNIQYNPLRGPEIELKQLIALNKWNVRPIIGDEAERNIVMSEICRSTNAVHISTHGELSDYDVDDLSPQDLALKKDVMDNSRLILAGYNDNPNSPLSYMSGSDVLKMKKTNAQVVFLDACLSGKGAVSVSGSVGIAEAFHLIGAKNIICYLEPISDDVATRFSDYFYKELALGATCHDAFFRAKNSLDEPIKVILWE